MERKRPWWYMLDAKYPVYLSMTVVTEVHQLLYHMQDP